MAISVGVEGVSGRNKRWVERLLTRALSRLCVRSADLSIAFVSRATSARLNVRYRHRRGATNILTFPLADRREPGILRGELCLCLSRVRQEAKAWRQTVAEHLALLLIHGLLHLRGYTHARRTDRERMERREQILLRQVLQRQQPWA